MTKLYEIGGIPVVDSREPVYFEITAEDIQGARRKQPNACAVARACARELHVKEARIHLGRIYLLKRGAHQWERYVTPASLRDEIIAFDRGGRFQPGEFYLAKIAGTKHATGQKRQGGPDNPARKRKRHKVRRPYHIVTDVRTGPATPKMP